METFSTGFDPIPPLTAENLAGIERVAAGSGRLARSWAQMTQAVRDRLSLGAGKRPRAQARLYANQTHYVVFDVASTAELAIEFGIFGMGGERQRLGRLQARWDELGLTGPYRIAIRGREHALGTFVAVLQHYLTLPEAN